MKSGTTSATYWRICLPPSSESHSRTQHCTIWFMYKPQTKNSVIYNANKLSWSISLQKVNLIPVFSTISLPPPSGVDNVTQSFLSYHKNTIYYKKSLLSFSFSHNRSVEKTSQTESRSINFTLYTVKKFSVLWNSRL